MNSPSDVTTKAGLEGIELQFNHDRARWVVPGAVSLVVVWLFVVLAGAALAGGLWLDWSLIELLLAFFMWGLLSAFTLPAMEYAGKVFAEHRFVQQLVLGAHRLQAGTEQSRLAWTVHDIVEIRASQDWISAAVTLRLRDGTVHWLRMGRMDTASWLAGVLETWWRERGTEPTEEVLRLQRALRSHVGTAR